MEDWEEEEPDREEEELDTEDELPPPPPPMVLDEDRDEDEAEEGLLGPTDVLEDTETDTELLPPEGQICVHRKHPWESTSYALWQPGLAGGQVGGATWQAVGLLPLLLPAEEPPDDPTLPVVGAGEAVVGELGLVLGEGPLGVGVEPGAGVFGPGFVVVDGAGDPMGGGELVPIGEGGKPGGLTGLPPPPPPPPPPPGSLPPPPPPPISLHTPSCGGPPSLEGKHVGGKK